MAKLLQMPQCTDLSYKYIYKHPGGGAMQKDLYVHIQEHANAEMIERYAYVTIMQGFRA